MSRKDKLLTRLQGKPKDFSWEEACALMKQCGFEIHKGKGSRRKFVKKEMGLVVILHKPHPQNVLKQYNLSNLIDLLKRAGEIKDE